MLSAYRDPKFIYNIHKDITCFVFDESVQGASDKSSNCEKIAMDGMHSYFNFPSISQQSDHDNLMEELNKTLEYCNMPRITRDWITEGVGAMPKSKYSQNSIELNPHYLSSGVRKLHMLRTVLTKRFIESAIQTNNQLTLIVIEEPENFLHPLWQKRLITMLETICMNRAESQNPIQFFIATHSPFIINAAIEADRPRYEKYKELINEKKIDDDQFKKLADENSDFLPYHKVYHLEDGQNVNDIDKKYEDKTGEGITIKNFAQGYDSILGSIGVQPSDLLFANGVIWVEGPSDAIYIEHWLNLFSKNKDYKPKKGKDYSFQLLSAVSLNNTGTTSFWDSEVNVDEVINLTEVNRKYIVAIDRDDNFTQHYQKNLQSNDPRKEKIWFFIDRIKKNKGINTRDYNGIINNKMEFWISANCYTIENYLQKVVSDNQNITLSNPATTKSPKSRLSTIFKGLDSKPSGSHIKAKAHYAKEICKKFSDWKDFSTGDDELNEKIEALYNTIADWNHQPS